MIFYSHSNTKYNFDGRPSIKTKADYAGVRIAYGIADRTSISVIGGLISNPKLESATSSWLGRSGYLFGAGINQEVFPSTDYWPGVILHSGFRSSVLFLDRQSANGITSGISQELRDLQYGGSLVSAWKWGKIASYAGPNVWVSDARWKNRQPSAGSPSRISGELKNKAGIILGSTMRITNNFDFQVEGRLINETTLNAGLNWSFKN